MSLFEQVRVLGLFMLLVACSSKEEGSAQRAANGPRGKVDASLPSDLTPLFDDLGDAIAKDLEAATKTPPKSRVGALEVLIGATPAGVTRHAEVLARHNVSAEALLASDSSAVTHQVDRITVKTEGPMRAFVAVVATLRETDESECRALARRIIELREQGPPKEAMVPALAVALPACRAELPNSVDDCFSKASDVPRVADYDACVAGRDKSP